MNILKDIKRRFTLLDFFVNQKCNLNCKICYVKKFNYNQNLNFKDIKKIIDEAINLGVKIMAIVGKEPLLLLETTLDILTYLKSKKRNYNIIYGIVTNGTLLNRETVKKLLSTNIDYIDISIDGTEEIHNGIRGINTFQKIVNNLDKVIDLTKDKLFIDFTLQSQNKNNLQDLIIFLYEKFKIKNIVVSPYLPIKKKDKLKITAEDYLKVVQRTVHLLDKNLKLKNINIYFKNDIIDTIFKESHSKFKLYQDILIKNKIIGGDIYLDKIKSAFYIKKIRSNKIFFNIILLEDDRIGFRINSNGDITDCLSMFKSQNYKPMGNIKTNSIKDAILHRVYNISNIK